VKHWCMTKEANPNLHLGETMNRSALPCCRSVVDIASVICLRQIFVISLS